MAYRNRHRLALALGSTAALVLFVASSASAHGFRRNASPDELAQRHQDMFQGQTALLSTTLDVVKNAWAQGKTMRELAQELGISDADLRAKVHAQRLSELKQGLQTLVARSIITQTQADQRYAILEQRLNQNQARNRHGIGLHGWQR